MVAVCKNPCYLLGDVRILKAVDVQDRPGVKDLKHLVDCIVFPVNGDRPHPDEIAGSDLDGDTYFVTWDPSLIPPHMCRPYDYPASASVSKETDMISYFARQNETQKLVAKVNRLFHKWADVKGVTSRQSQELGKWFSSVIDSSKTGQHITIPNHLQEDAIKDDVNEDSVWLVMTREAGKRQADFKSNMVQNLQSSSFVSPEFVEEVLEEPFSNITEFDKFKFVHRFTNDVDEVLEYYVHNINFAMFSLDERREAFLSGVPKDLLENALNKSTILASEDLDAFKMQTFRHPWCYYFRSEHENFNWNHLLRALTEQDQTFLAFKIPDGITVVLQFLRKCELGREQSIPGGTITGFLWSSRFGYTKKYVLGGDYFLDLTSDTLQLYRNKQKNLTFVWLNASDVKENKHHKNLSDENVNAISVSLVRFDGNLLRDLTRPHPKVRKLPFLEIEVYAHSSSQDVAYFDTYDANDLMPVSESEDVDEDEMDEMNIDTESMMMCSDEFTFDTEDEFLQTLKEAVETTQPLAFKMIQEAGKGRHYDCQAEVEIMMTELLENLLVKIMPLEAPDPVKDILSTVLENLKIINPSLMCKILGLLSRLGMNDSARRFCGDLQKIPVSMEQFIELIGNWQLWWMHDKDMAKEILSKLLIFRREPSSDVTENISEDDWLNKYVVHFGFLQLLELLHEMDCVKQKMNEVKCDITLSNLKLLPHTSGDTMTFCRDSPIDPRSKISKGQYVAITRQADFNRTKSFKSYCCLGQIVMFSCTPVSLVVKLSGDIPIMLKNANNQNKWRVSVIANATTHKRVVNALERLILTDDQKQFAPSPDVLNMIIHPGGHLEESSLHIDIPFSLYNNKARYCSEDLPIEGLNQNQQTAVRMAIDKRISLIQGPPGTGKTTVACCIIRELQSMGCSKMLVVAETNVAVDNITKRLKRGMSLGILRIGSEGGIDPEVFDVTLEGQLKLLEDREGKKTMYRDSGGVLQKKKRLVKKLLQESRVVLTTCAGAGDPDLNSMIFDVVLVDEATQTKETTLLCSLTHGANHVIMIGDPQQLGPMVVKDDSSSSPALPRLDSLAISLYHRLHARVESVFLNVQHRMHPALMKFPSDQFYDGKLKSAVENIRRPRVGFPWPDDHKPMCFINVEGIEQRLGTSFCNKNETNAIQLVLETLFSISEEDRDQRVDATEVGILSLYQGQVKEIKQSITFPVQVSSVDGFQGKENEVIIVSTVRSNSTGSVGFVDDRNRTNVLLTRAKRGLIVVGNEKTLLHSSIWSRWLHEVPRLDIDDLKQKMNNTKSNNAKGPIDHDDSGNYRGSYRGQGRSRGRSRGQGRGRDYRKSNNGSWRRDRFRSDEDESYRHIWQKGSTSGCRRGYHSGVSVQHDSDSQDYEREGNNLGACGGHDSEWRVFTRKGNRTRYEEGSETEQNSRSGGGGKNRWQRRGRPF